MVCNKKVVSSFQVCETINLFRIMKLMYVFLVASAIFLSSCMASHTCPTYMKKDTKETTKRA